MKLGSVALWVLLCAVAASTAPAQPVHTRVVVTDSATSAPLSHVRAHWSERATGRTHAAYTDAAGLLAIELRAGEYTLVLTRLGYRAARFDDIEVSRNGSPLRFALTALGAPIDPVVISASRSDQALLDAPAAVSVIGRDAVESGLSLDPLDQIRALPGVDFASKGLIQSTFGVRGPRNPTQRGPLMLTDYRYSDVPAVVTIAFLRPTTREDIERIEVVRGPAAALYGPGAPQGVVHIITRSPFESRGGVISLTGGERSILQATTRYAGVIHPRLAMSMSIDYLEGDDWETIDSTEIDNRAAALRRGASPDTLRIGVRDYSLRRLTGETRIDWRPAAATTLVTKAGFGEAPNALDLSGLGAVQLRNWRAWYVQSRLQHARLMLNVAGSANNSGDSYFLRTGGPLVEQSRMLAVQLQHGAQRGRSELVYGLDVRGIEPRTGGTVHGAYEDDDFIRETGSYVQATTALLPRLQLVSALRVDQHSRMRDVAFSPRAALIYKPGRTHAVRLTYNRAFNSPLPNELFLDTRVNTLTDYPYEIRQSRVPLSGFTFRRNCNGLCMHSPYSASGADVALPANATLLWAEMVELLARRGISIADIPAPTASAVGTALANRNQGQRTWLPIAAQDVKDLPPLRRTITNALELGYRGAVRGGTVFNVDLHATRVHRRLLGTAVSSTPNVFFERSSLETFLRSYRSAQEAAEIAAVLAQIPVGIVTPVESPYPTDILLLGRQGQSYTLFGIDVAAEVPLGSHVSLAGSYSWLNYDTVSVDLPGTPVNLALPKRKASAEAIFRNRNATLLSSLRIRTVGGLGPRQGSLFRDPPVRGYAVADVSTSYRMPPSRRLTVGGELRNAFDRVHREVLGGPLIGRLGVVRTRLEF